MKFAMSFSSILALTLIASTPVISRPLEKPQRQTSAPSTQIAQNTTPDSTAGALDFFRALFKISQQETHNLKSEMILRIATGGLDISSTMNIETLLGSENQFNSLLSYEKNLSGEPRDFRVISNGASVWIHDIANNIYSVMPYASFQKTYRDRIFIGLYTTFLIPLKAELGLDETFKDIPAEALTTLLENQPLAQEFASTLQAENIVIGTEQVNGSAWTTVSLADETDKFTMTMLIEPESAEIRDIRMLGNEENFTFSVDEAIRQDNSDSNSSVAGLFSFTPPDNAQLSNAPISISPF